MSIGDVIVSFDQINKAMENRESVMKQIQEGAEKTAPSISEESVPKEPAMAPAEAAAMISAFGEALRTLEAEEMDRGRHVLSCVDHMAASLLQSYLAERSEEIQRVERGPTDLREAKFDDKDFGAWIGSFFTWWRGIKKHPWISPPDEPEPLNDQIRVALLGDWGTGMYGAPISAGTIQREKKHSLLIHLGDVYYSGTEKEVEDRFIKIWPRIDGAKSRAVNSNHEMYTGGYAYFRQTLKHFGQPASCFALQNANWLLVGVDSAYKNPHKGQLTEDQVEWIGRLLDRAGTRRIVLFSHHQPFSWFDRLDAGVSRQLEEFLIRGKIFAWYWGHEHRCIMYDQYEQWGLHGRCVGHSGYPYFRDDLDDEPVVHRIGDIAWRRLDENAFSPGCIVLNGPNRHMPKDEDPNKYGTQGHMTLEFNGKELKETVHSPTGEVLYEHDFK